MRYIVNSWNDAHDTPISEDAVLLFLCDETKGDLTEEQRAFAKMRREEIQSGIRRMICEWLLYDSMVPQGCAGRLPAVSQTASAAPGERFPGPAYPPACAPLWAAVWPDDGRGRAPPLPAGSGRCGPVVGGVAAQGFRPFLNGTEGRKKEQDKQRGRKRPCLEHLCPQCGQLRGLLRGLEMGSKSGP